MKPLTVPRWTSITVTTAGAHVYLAIDGTTWVLPSTIAKVLAHRLTAAADKIEVQPMTYRPENVPL